MYSCKTKLLWWQKRGLMFTKTGYGKKIPTDKIILDGNKWKRIYCTIYSNIGTCFFMRKGKEIIVNNYELTQESIG